MDKEVLNVKDVSEYLGISESIVRRLIKERRIPFLKIEGCYRFFLPSVKAWLQERSLDLNGDNTLLTTKKITDKIWNNLGGH